MKNRCRDESREREREDERVRERERERERIERKRWGRQKKERVREILQKMF